MNPQGSSEFQLRNVTYQYAEFNVTQYFYQRASVPVIEGFKIIFVVELERSPTYFAVVVVAPTFLIATLTFAGIFCPQSESGIGELVGFRSSHLQINLGMGSLLALIFMLSIVTDSMPRATTLPLMGSTFD